MKQKIINHFLKRDPILHAAIKELDILQPTSADNYLSHLCEIIIQQQLSEKVGDVIFARFEKLFPKEIISPEKLLRLSDEKIRKIGTSNMKVKYLKNLARHFTDNQSLRENLYKMENESVISELTKIKGIGRWSAEMFLMFSLGREDVFSYGDLGLRRAIQKLYKMKKEPTQKQAERLADKWKPYRTYACRILWSSLDG